jgi:drug/metabolite transporter (DMT)-like permease
MALVASDPLFAFKLGASDIPAIVAVSVSGLAAHYCLAQAFRAGDAMIVIPLDYLRLPLIAVVAWLFLGEALDPYVFVGAAIMIAGILWNLHSEARGR